MNAERKGSKRAGRWLGGLIFTVGIVMLVAVFVLAAVAFAEIPEALGGSESASGSGVGGVLAAAGVRAGFLLVMAYVSSLLASKGLELYQAAREAGGE